MATTTKASTVSCSTANIGTKPTITISRASSSYTHKLTYSFGSLSGTIVERTSLAVYTDWTLPTDFYYQISDAIRGSGTIYCYTYNGSTLIGSSSCSFTATVNREISRPTIAPLIRDINSLTTKLTGDSNVIVRYYSSVRVTPNANAHNGATLVSTEVGIGGKYWVVPDSGVVDIGGVEAGNFWVEAKDSRYFTTQVGLNLETAGRFVPYVRLTCNIENTRPDASGNMDVRCTGSYFNESFGAYENSLTVKCRYKNPSGTYSDWYSMTVTKNGNYYGAYKSLTISNFDYQAVYSFECVAVDQLMSVSATPSTAKSMPVFHWSEDDFVFEVPVTFNAGVNNSATSTTSTDQTIDGDLNVTGDLRLKGSGNYGNRLRFGDGDYCYIDEPSDDVMTIHAKKINLDTTNGVYLGSNQIPNVYTGSWTPSLSSSAISSYSTQSGWYTRIGQVVSIGFYVKATCKSGYDSTLVTIEGLPYVPSGTSSGSGMCSGAHVSAGFNFQCYVAETSGKITTRVQACNNTTATSLSTSASGCWYRSGGGEITLSGTITYLTSS